MVVPLLRSIRCHLPYPDPGEATALDHYVSPLSDVAHAFHFDAGLGQGIVPRSYHPMVDLMGDRETRQMVAGMRKVLDTCVAAMPTNAEFIARHCAAGGDVPV